MVSLLFGGLILLRFADAFRPLNIASWRECDLGSIARNFAFEDPDPLYPRVDWRGDGPGYAEMELPLYPYLTSIAYRLFGFDDHYGRILSFVFSIGSLIFFYKLARQYLEPLPAIVAFSFFGLNPLVVETATAVQPEGLMLMFYLGGVLFFLRWLREDRRIDLALAAVMTAMSLLAKAPSAHIGLFFGILLFERFGWSAFRRIEVYLFGLVTLVPALLWATHAKGLYSTYGNSLGVSNEHHWIGWDFFTDSEFMAGILRSEFFYVWAGFGVVALAFAVVRGYSERPVRLSLLWLASVFVFYLLAARTTSQEWASYYHVFSIAPVSLLFGSSLARVRDHLRETADKFSLRPLAANIFRASLAIVVVISVLASLAVEGVQARRALLNRRVPEPAFIWAEKVRPLLDRDGLIVVSGGNCHDKRGHQLAYNASYFFYWLERRGWNTCVERQSVAVIRSFAERGAEYFVAQHSMTRQTAGFDDAVRREYALLDETPEFSLYDLRRPAAPDRP